MDVCTFSSLSQNFILMTNSLAFEAIPNQRAAINEGSTLINQNKKEKDRA